MTVKELRKALEGLDDNMLVVRPGYDHNYVPLRQGDPIYAHDGGRCYLGEYQGIDREEDFGPRTLVFLVE